MCNTHTTPLRTSDKVIVYATLWTCAVSAATRCLATEWNKCPPWCRGASRSSQTSSVLAPILVWSSASFQSEPTHPHDPGDMVVRGHGQLHGC